jgi:MFS family permease
MSQPRFFYGWYITGTALTAYFFSNGIGLFVPPNLYPRLIEEFGVSSFAVSVTGIITLVVSGVTAPLAGWIVDRSGVIRIIRIGVIILAVTATLYPFAGAIWHLYLLHAGLGLGLSCAGLMVNVVLLSKWFKTGRGKAVGLLVTGSSLAGFLMPRIIAPLVQDPELGWRYGMGLLAILMWLVTVPAVFLLMREKPEQMGLRADGAAVTPGTDVTSPATGLSFAQALRTATFWCLALGSFSLWLSITGLSNQLTLFLETDAGLSPADATSYYSFAFLFSAIGKFGFGWLSDRLSKRNVMLLAASSFFIACGLLFQPGEALSLTKDPNQLFAFVVFFGFGFGGCFTMIQMLCIDSFGNAKDLGKIYGTIVLGDTIGAAIGIAGVSSLRDATGSYLLAFILITGIAFFALINMYFVRPVGR